MPVNFGGRAPTSPPLRLPKGGLQSLWGGKLSSPQGSVGNFSSSGHFHQGEPECFLTQVKRR